MKTTIRKKLHIAILSIALCIALAIPIYSFADGGYYWPSFRGNDANNAVVSVPAPKKADEGELYWAVKKGEGYGGKSVGAPIIVDDWLVFCSGTGLFRANRYTGEIDYDHVGQMASSPNFNIVPPTYADGKIFVPLQNSTIQAFDASTMQALWTYRYKDGSGKDGTGQGNTQISYKNGKVYTGFWSGEAKENVFVCVDATTGEHVWDYASLGGFYWAGAYVSDSFLLVGTDDGESGYAGSSKLLSLNPVSGALIDSIDGFKGDIRTSVAYDSASDRYYFGSKGGSFYSVAVNEDGTFPYPELGAKGDLRELAIKQLLYANKTDENVAAMITSTPVIADGRAYVGFGGSSQFGKYAGHGIAVVDLATFSLAYRIRTMGYPQSSGMVNTYYKAGDGYNYIYFTDNYTPGIVRVVKDKPGQTAPESPMTDTYVDAGNEYIYRDIAPTLFTPVSPHANNCLGSVIVDDEGTLYFKNDSAHLMAFGSKNLRLEVAAKPSKLSYKVGEKFNPAGMKIYSVLANGVKRDVTALVKYSTSPLGVSDRDVTISYEGMQYHDRTVTGAVNTSGIISDSLETVIDISVTPPVIPGWNKNADGTYSYVENGKTVVGWKDISGSRYYFNEKGIRQTSWQNIKQTDGKTYRYYFGGASDGRMKTGWQNIKQADGKTYRYYFGAASDGRMKTGWQNIKQANGKTYRYYFGAASDGRMKSGWQNIKKGKKTSRYYFGGASDGKMRTGWKTIKGKRYYFGGANDGKMRTGKVKIGGKYYTFTSNGTLRR